MNCPYCGNPMEKGFMYSNKFFEQFWVPGELTLKNCLKSSKRIKAQDFALTGIAMEGFYCKDCKKLIIETELSD